MKAVGAIIAVALLTWIAVTVANSWWFACHFPTEGRRQSIAFAMQCYANGIVDVSGRHIR